MSIKNTEIYQKQLNYFPRSSHGEKVKLCIVELLKLYPKARDVAKHLSTTEQNISKHLASLKRAGFVEKTGYGTWEILKEFDPNNLTKSSTGIPKTGRDLKDKKSLVVSEDDIRGHAFVIRFKIKKNIKNWDKRLEVLKERFKELKPKELKGGVAIRFKGRKIHLWNESIVIYETKSFLSKAASISKTTALYDLQQLLKSLENKLGMKETFTVNNQYKFTVSREHYGMVKNALAKQFDKDGNKLQIYNEHGCWMVIDNSYNLHEWEIMKTREDTAVQDSEALQAYWNDHKKHNFKVTPSFTLELMNGIQGNQLVFDNNMKSHLEVLNKIGDKIGKVASEVIRFGKAINKLNKKIK